MPIHLRENQYPGVNAHLHSYLQNEPGGWESFHTDYITFLRVALDAQLPSGYVARSEMGLQISEITPFPTTPSRTRTDVTIFQTRPTSGLSENAGITSMPTALLSIPETLEIEEYLPGLMIYQSIEGQSRPVTRIEVLSPANKPGGSHYPRYIEKRIETLQAGLRLIEIDFLHETRPIIRGITSYPDREAEAYPYSIIVTDPRPSFEEGQSKVYGFSVGDTIPVIEIPLADADVIVFDFGAVYNQFYANTRFFGETVDYEQLPVRFETYSPDDQQRIRAQMQAVSKNIQR